MKVTSADRPDDSTFLPTRSSLLSRLKTWEDAQSWSEFFNTYGKSIQNLARKCHLTPGETEEVVQETMLAVAKQMPGFQYDRSVGSFKNWLYSISKGAISRQFTRRARGFNGSSDVESDRQLIENLPDTGMSFEKQWEDDWRRNLLVLAMDRVQRKVKPKHYQIFDLYVTQHIPMSSVRRLLNVSSAQIYIAKFRVTALIKKEIEGLDKQLV